MDYCFLDKNINGDFNHKNLEHFHEFLRGYTDIFINRNDAAKAYTYRNLPGTIQNEDIITVSGYKDFSAAIMKKSDYVTKLDTMINDGIMKNNYVETIDNTLKEISRLQDFLFKKLSQL